MIGSYPITAFSFRVSQTAVGVRLFDCIIIGGAKSTIRKKAPPLSERENRQWQVSLKDRLLIILYFILPIFVDVLCTHILKGVQRR